MKLKIIHTRVHKNTNTTETHKGATILHDIPENLNRFTIPLLLMEYIKKNFIPYIKT
jgi:hypothetical protein